MSLLMRRGGNITISHKKIGLLYKISCRSFFKPSSFPTTSITPSPHLAPSRFISFKPSTFTQKSPIYIQKMPLVTIKNNINESLTKHEIFPDGMYY